MEKKFKFSENPSLAKTLYGVVIAALCVTALVIGLIAANNNGTDDPVDDLPTVNAPDPTPSEDEPEKEEQKPEKLEFISPVSGSILRNHDLFTPVFSTTLEEWRVHAGLDISTEEAAQVFAAERGEITKIYNDPMLGHCIEITHSEELKSVYANLDPQSTSLVNVGDVVVKGQSIGRVGDSSISELAEEPHLHLEFIKNGEKMNPLDFICEESKKSSLGMAA